MRPVEVRRVNFGGHKAFRRPVDVWAVHFDQCKVCRRPVQVRRVRYVLCAGRFLEGLWMIRESVLITAKHVGGLYRFGESI